MSERIGGILQRALDGHGLKKRIERRIPARVWREAVGAELSARAQPTFLSAGVLHVLVIDHRWRDQLDAARAFLLARVNERLGKALVKSFQFGLGHAGAFEQARLENERVTQAPVEAEAQVSRAAERVPAALGLPAEIREAFLLANAASMVDRGWRV
ncbi:MAG: DUF721 domain-containing protein [Deltaproteobacteria bacterium]|nr:DUF721 domain-containing protein [Deltaproteobacteria bacterium]